MKKICIATLIAITAVSANAQIKGKTVPAKKPVTTTKSATSKAPVKAVSFKNNLDSASYALGLNVASSFKSGGLNTINYELFNKGLKDVFAAANPLLSQESCQTTINKLFEGFSKQREDVDKQKYASNINEGNAYLTQNRSRADVKTTPTGLQYEVITPGTGASPKATDVVTVHYKGTLLNGTQFDSSYDRGEPATFSLNQVISGWTEGLQLMKEGAKYRFVIPYQLAYGSRATPDGSITPYSTLIFEVELIKVGQ